MTMGVLLLGGILAVPTWAANKEIERLYLQIAALQSEVAQMRRTSDDTLKELRRLNEVLAEQNALVRKGVQDQQRQGEATQLAVREIADQLASLKDRVQQMIAAPAPPAEPVAAIAGPTAGPAPVAGAAPAPIPPAAGELYTQAYADYARGDYDLAIQEFQQYLKLFPTAHLADNAQYWVGECLFGKRQYPEAVAAWDELLRQFPGTDKIPDARYKKAMALEKMGRRSQALLEYRYVFEHFPNSEAGRKAREKVQAQ